MPGRRRSYGFTLIEVLVCACVVVLLIALLGPLILSAQSSSREQKCRDNLRQLGLAMHNYHDTQASFPPGWITADSKSTAGGGTGWQTSLLPYLPVDHTVPLFHKIFARGSSKFPNVGEADAAPFHTAIPLYRCPADSMDDRNALRGNWSTSNYSGNGGILPFPRWTSISGTQYWPGKATLDPALYLYRLGGGIFGPNAVIRITSITDGTSNTILVGERSVASGAGIWPGTTSNLSPNDVITDGSHNSRPQHNMSSFSSPHKHVLFLMCDGVVRPIRKDIESRPNSDPSQPLGIFQKLMSRDDGQVITP